ncbi:MAG: hypothetical protein QOE87_3229 [Gaiellales bacterium]|nr:hypothetical protein [Gaiellales bacterium]
MQPTYDGSMNLRSSSLIDRLIAGLCACILLANLVREGSAQAHPTLALLLTAASCVPLVWRRSHPLGVLIVTMTCLTVLAAVLGGGDAAIAVALVPLFGVAALGDRRRSLAIGVATTVLLVTAIVLLERDVVLSSGAVRLLLPLGALALGDIVRSRRALRAEAALRAARDAHDRESEHRRRLADERLRIAREVHDSIAHALVAINVQAGVAAHLGATAGAHAALLDIKSVSAEALGDLRATLGLLRESHESAPTEPPLGLDALPQLVERARGAGLSAEADFADIGAAIPTTVGQAGFRIVQESLTNVLRHADATRASIRVRVRQGALEIEVENDGRDASPAVAGLGLRGMAERADALGGRLVAGPRAGGGWRVHALLPLAVDPA